MASIEAGESQSLFGSGHSHVVEPARSVAIFVLTDSLPATVQQCHMIKLQSLGSVSREKHQSCLPAAHLASPFSQPFSQMSGGHLSVASFQVLSGHCLAQQ